MKPVYLKKKKKKGERERPAFEMMQYEIQRRDVRSSQIFVVAACIILICSRNSMRFIGYSHFKFATRVMHNKERKRERRKRKSKINRYGFKSNQVVR